MLPLVATFFLSVMRYFNFFQFFIFLVLSLVVVSLPSCKKTVMGCADPLACNYSEDVTEDNGSCIYSSEFYDCNDNCLEDSDGDGVCDENEVFGCIDETACNYNSNATEDDLSCDFVSCLGCTDANAFNYNPEATIDDGTCQEANEIMASTWSVTSECDGMLVGAIIPDEISISEGANEGELVLDLGIGITINGTIDQEGNILIPSQEIDIVIATVTVNGNGQLNTETSATIYINFSTLIVSDNCVLTLTM